MDRDSILQIYFAVSFFQNIAQSSRLILSIRRVDLLPPASSANSLDISLSHRSLVRA